MTLTVLGGSSFFGGYLVGVLLTSFLGVLFSSLLGVESLIGVLFLFYKAGLTIALLS